MGGVDLERRPGEKRERSLRSGQAIKELIRRGSWQEWRFCRVLLAETRKAACHHWRGYLCPLMRCFTAVKQSMSAPPWWGVGWEKRGGKGTMRQRNGMEWNRR
jgi:hypothetical protein